MLRKPATAVTMARLPHAQIASFVDLKQMGFNLVFFMSVTGLTESSLWTSAPIAKKTLDASPEPHSHGYDQVSRGTFQLSTDLKGTMLHFKMPTAERRHVLCIGVLLF